jgi:hypothetical protein
MGSSGFFMTKIKDDPTKDPEFQKVVQVCLRTPPKPHKSLKKSKSKADASPKKLGRQGKPE